MYHTNSVSPVESYQRGPNGELGNGFMNLPLCKKTYTVYDYNYGRGLGEALEDHTHHLESLFGNVDNETWGKFIGGATEPFACGRTHCPSNVMFDCANHEYDWANERNTLSDCRNWKKDRSGQKEPVSCHTWAGQICGNDSGDKFKVWWMQNMPTNWWIFVGDDDEAIKTGKHLEDQSSASPTPTPFPPPTSVPKTLTLVLVSGTDDAYQSADVNKQMTTNSADIKLGWYMSRAGFRFANNQLIKLKNETIKSATLSLTSSLNGGSPIKVRIYGEASDACKTFTTTKNDLGGRIGTSKSVFWDLSKTAWGINARYSSSDPKIIIQEIVSRPGFFGSSLCLLLQQEGSAKYSQGLVAAKENTVRSSATLTIVYYPKSPSCKFC